MTTTQLMLGDCLDKLKELKDNSIDSIVTDPPYGLSFMGKKWDQMYRKTTRLGLPANSLMRDMS